MHLFTVFTPTHNRAHLLPNLYECLKKQTFQDFLWMIVDDGSVDNTKDVVDNFVREGIIDIEYYFIPNGYKHKAYKLSSEKVKTPYYIDIDDDDELTSDCLQKFKEKWDEILDDSVGEIRALSIYSDTGKVVGNYMPLLGSCYISTYTDEFLVKNRRLENLTCRKSSVLNEVFDINKDWLYDKVTYVSDAVFWFRISKHFKTYYMNIPLRIYNNTTDSISRAKNRNASHYYNLLFSAYHFLNEMENYYFKRPSYFFVEMIVYIVSGIKLKLPIKKLVSTLDSPICKLLFILLLIPSWVYSLTYKIDENS